MFPGEARPTSAWPFRALAVGAALIGVLALSSPSRATDLVSPLQPHDCGSDFVKAISATGAITCAPGATVHDVPAAVGWPAALDPNNVVLANINQDSTITAIVGAVEVPVGSAATLTVSKAASGTACSAGTVLHSGSFDANGTAATNQTLTVTTASLTAGDRICLQTTNGSNWTGGVGIGTITVFLSPS